MKLSCQEGMVPGRDFKEKLSNLEKFGYQGIELGGANLKAREKEIQQALSDSSVKVSSICAGYKGTLLAKDPQERKSCIQEIKELLSIAGRFGATGLIVVPIFGQPQIPDLSPLYTAWDLERKLLVELCQELGEHAEKVGSLVLLEPLNRYETHFLNRLEQAIEICKEVGSPGVRIMADFFHMNIEEADIPKSIREAKGFIRHVHLADSNRLLPGYGHTDFASGFKALRDIGFDDYMALECGMPGPGEVELPRCAQYLRRCWGS